MDAWVPIVVAVVALGGPILGYLASTRKASGRVRASDASELWAEAGDIRRECAKRVEVLEARNAELEDDKMTLQMEVWRLQRSQFGDGHA
jgi:hypothetical protein